MKEQTAKKISARMTLAQLPTAQDVLATNESKHLYRTNLLRLQLDELRSTITPNYGKIVRLNKLVNSTCQALCDLETASIPKDCYLTGPSLGLSAPLLSDLLFQRPAEYEVMGSFKSQSLVRPFQNVDVVISIPNSCLSDRDIKRNRYFDKKRVYCAELARQLRSKLVDTEVDLTSWNGDKNKPIVLISVPSSQWKIQIIPVASASMFDQQKLLPNYKNLDESNTCDPLYNASILEDMYFRTDIFTAPRFVHFASAVQFVKVWLHRRGLLVTTSNHAGLSGYHIRVLLSHVCHNLPREVSAYQLFKLFISLLANTDWRKSVLVHGSSVTRARANDSLPYPIIECQQLGIYNPLWRVSLLNMEELAMEAKQSLALLDDVSVSDPFEWLFCQTSRPRDFEITIRNFTGQARKVAEDIAGALRTGLGTRLSKQQIYLRFTSEGSISIKGDIDSSSASTLVDRGPSADSTDAAEYRSFWGKKAELRRFKDGSILECVVWDPKSGPVAEQIIQFLMGAKFPELKVDISFCPLGACQTVSKSHIGLWSALETLRSKLTSITNLPISIVSLRPSHEKFTGTDLISQSGVSAPLDCVVEFESSQAWPATKIAIWHSKCAFMLAMREGLMSQYCAVEIGAEDMSQEPFMDVRMMDNNQALAFRIRIFANVERQRLLSQLSSSDNPPTLADIATVGQLWFKPMLRTRIHALSSLCPAITGAITQAKVWLDNHLLLQPWLSDWVEVSMAYVVESKGAMVPQSPHVAFLDWLFFIANHNYSKEPVFARLAGDANDSELLSGRYELSIEGRRAWWISSDIDPDCLFMHRPTEWESSRIQSLAKVALERAFAKQWDLIKFGTDNSRIFDVIIKVKPEFVSAMDGYVKILNEQFRKYVGIQYSKQHGIIGLRLEKGSFRPQSKSVLEKSKMLTVVEELAIPDITVLLAKLGALMKGIAESIRVRA